MGDENGVILTFRIGRKVRMTPFSHE